MNLLVDSFVVAIEQHKFSLLYFNSCDMNHLKGYKCNFSKKIGGVNRLTLSWLDLGEKYKIMEQLDLKNHINSQDH